MTKAVPHSVGHWGLVIGHSHPCPALQFPAAPARPSGMPRLKAADRRQQLVSVATRLFAERGYEATTTAAIAEAAGVTEPILYRHFENKQDLFVAIVREMSELTMRHWKELTAGTDDPAEAIRRIARQFPAHVSQL